MATENATIKLDIDVDNSLKSLRELKLEQKALTKDWMQATDDLRTALAAGDTATANSIKKRITETQKAIAGLKGDAEDGAAALKMMDPGNLLEGYSNMARGAVGAFGAVTGAMSAVGIENETLNAIQKSGNAIIQVMIALQEVHKTVIDRKARTEAKAAIQSTVAYVKELAVKTASVAVSVAQAVATGVVTAAQWLLNAAMAANPVGLVVLAVVALIAGFWALYEATGSVTEALLWMVNPLGMLVGLMIKNATQEEKVDDARKKTIESSKAKLTQIEKEIKQTKERIAQMDREIELMEKSGASEKELRDARRIASAERIKQQQQEMQALIQKGIIEAQESGTIDINRVTELLKMQDDLNKAVKAQKKQEEDWKAEDTKTAKEKAKQDAEDAKERAKALKKAREENRKDVINDILAQNLAIAEAEGDLLKIRDAREAIVKQKMQDEITAAIDKNKKRITTKAEYEAEIIRIEKDAQLATDAIDKEIDNSIKEKEETRKNAIIDFNKKVAIENMSAYEKEINDVNEHYDDLIKTAKKLGIDTTELEKKRVQAIGTINKTAAETEKTRVEEFQKEMDKFKKPNPDVAQAIIDSQAQEIADYHKNVDEKKITEAEFQKWLIEKNKETTQKIADAEREKQIQTISSVAENINKINSVIQDAIKTRIDNIDIEYNRDVDNLKASLNSGLITQAQYDEKSANLEKIKNNKIRIEKEKAWKIQHAVDIANATAQAAIAVAQVFARESGELVVKSAAAAIAAGIAAANVAVIASQKMPKFARGGMITGPSHQNGGTLIEAEGGEAIVNANSMRLPGVANLLSAVNTAGGGVPFINSSVNSSGSSLMSATISNESVNAIVNQVVSQIVAIPVIVSETDITKTQRKIAVIEGNSIY